MLFEGLIIVCPFWCFLVGFSFCHKLISFFVAINSRWFSGFVFWRLYLATHFWWYNVLSLLLGFWESVIIAVCCTSWVISHFKACTMASISICMLEHMFLYTPAMNLIIFFFEVSPAFCFSASVHVGEDVFRAWKFLISWVYFFLWFWSSFNIFLSMWCVLSLNFATLNCCIESRQVPLRYVVCQIMLILNLLHTPSMILLCLIYSFFNTYKFMQWMVFVVANLKILLKPVNIFSATKDESHHLTLYQV